MLTQDFEVAAARAQQVIDRERTTLALTAAHMAAFEWDRATGEVVLGDGAEDLTGVSGSGFFRRKGESMQSLVPPEDQEQVSAAIRDSLATSGRYRLEHRILRADDGREAWLASAGVLITDPEGGPGRVIGVIQDITERRRAEEQRETLLAELDHRVKNVLATVQSLAGQSARKAMSLEGFLKTFTGRLQSMASAHQLLTATRWRGAGMRNIAAAELGGLAPGQTRWEGDDISLTPRAANAMSLALHELATNAIKFGALSSEVGRVNVRWRRTDEGGLELEWVETGGPTVGAPARRGFGSTLLERVTGRELGGSARVDFAHGGVRAVLTAAPAAVAAIPAIAAGQAPDAREPHPAPAVIGASAGPPRSAEPIRIDGLKVLIVEDALLLTLELEAGLTEAGAEVIGTAAELDEAIKLSALPMDAAVLDANLNGQSVAPVAEALKAQGVPFVFATGYGESAFAPQGYDAPIIRKPYDVTQVTAALATITGRG